MCLGRARRIWQWPRRAPLDSGTLTSALGIICMARRAISPPWPTQRPTSLRFRCVECAPALRADRAFDDTARAFGATELQASVAFLCPFGCARYGTSFLGTCYELRGQHVAGVAAAGRRRGRRGERPSGHRTPGFGNATESGCSATSTALTPFLGHRASTADRWMNSTSRSNPCTAPREPIGAGHSPSHGRGCPKPRHP